jgi:hypothetical protein
VAQVRNRLNQPIIVDPQIEGVQAEYFAPKEVKNGVTDEVVNCKQMQFAISAGYLVIDVNTEAPRLKPVPIIQKEDKGE